MDDGNMIFGKNNVWDSKVEPKQDPCGKFIHPRDIAEVGDDDQKMYTHISHLLGCFEKDDNTNE
jgi:hypothetical protein